MTGQLFVVPATRPVDPYERLALALDDGRELRFRDIRKFGRVGLYGAGRRPVRRRRTRSRWTTGSRSASSGGGSAGVAPASSRCWSTRRSSPGVGNIYADEALWRSKLHPLRSARSLRPHDERALYLNIREILAEAVERRGSSIDDYTAPDGDGEMQERLDVYQRTGLPCPRCGPADPADRHRDPVDALLLVLPAAARRRSGPPRRSCWRR